MFEKHPMFYLNICPCFRCTRLFRKETRVQKMEPCAVDLSGSPRRRVPGKVSQTKKHYKGNKRQHLSVTPYWDPCIV